jgi:phage tail-like protein
MPRPDPFRAFRFRVEVGSRLQAGFQAVSGLERQTVVEPYREGGINAYEHQLVTMTTYPPLVLKRGLIDAELWDWHQDVITGTVKREAISVILFDEQNEEAWRMVCAAAFPAKWTGADLDAGTNGIFTESLEFVHQGLTKQ